MSKRFLAAKWTGAQREGSSLESHDMVAGLDRRHAFSYRLHYASALMAKYDGKCSLGILAR
jgi:hypothetical protein